MFLAPRWDEDVQATAHRGRNLEISIFHKELVGGGRFLASVTVPFTEFITGSEGSQLLWFNLEPAGKVCLKIQFKKANPGVHHVTFLIFGLNQTRQPTGRSWSPRQPRIGEVHSSARRFIK